MSDLTASSATQQKLDFMTLLVTELQHQNPMEPMDNQQMASQLAQFTQLELTENMNTSISDMNSTMSTLNGSFEGAMLVATMNYAKSLLGNEVSFYSEHYGQTVQGTVRKITFEDGQPMLSFDGTVEGDDGSTRQEPFTIPLGQVEGIHS